MNLKLTITALVLVTTCSCLPPLTDDFDGDGYNFSTDCDDNNPDINPDADEFCDSLDNNCDGEIDEDSALDAMTWYYDTDGDGYGGEASLVACAQPSGYVEQSGDCNDSDARFHPGAEESDCTDPNDYNCDGSVGYADEDSDGFAACEECDDSNENVYPGADEYCNEVDDDCDGSTDEDESLDASVWYNDADGDNYGDLAITTVACVAPIGYVESNTDCDDANSAVNPMADEFCNGYDDDCDSDVDEDDSLNAVTWFHDADDDTYGDASLTHTSCEAPTDYVPRAGDCDDSDTRFHPGAVEFCEDPNDYNCDGSTGYADVDTDGFAACEECDDGNAAVFPGADEYCNGLDDNCDGTIDEDESLDAVTWYFDGDADNFGDASLTYTACEAPEFYVADSTDCNDSEATVNPAANEYCNEVDDDCDGETDEDDALDATTWYLDTDTDGYGDASQAHAACVAPVAHVATDTDCNDSDPATYPGAPERCNSADDDCDGTVDNDLVYDTWYADADADGYGDAAVSAYECSQPSGYVLDSTDCDDLDNLSYPGATEYCDSADNDCDGSTDESSAVDADTWYRDADSDGYGDLETSTVSCSPPSGFVSDSSDCDDSNSAINPAASEVCNDLDDDCDGTVDEDLGGSYWFEDADSDSYGNPSSSVYDCSEPSGFVADSTDCDDTDATVNPDGNEVCDGVDNDCDGTVDIGSLLGDAYWIDADNDGYGAESTVPMFSCFALSGYTDNDEDCDDADDEINPDADEYCDGVDTDCDGTLDEDDALDAEVWYLDDDGDGYGDATVSYVACSSPLSYVADDTDCDDTDDEVNPGAEEVCDGIDNNCDGTDATTISLDDLEYGDLVVVEFMSSPNRTSDSAGEWIELYNTSGCTIEVTNFGLDNLSGTETSTTSGCFTSEIAPGDLYLLGSASGSLIPDCEYNYGVFNMSGVDSLVVSTLSGMTLDDLSWTSVSIGYSWSLDLGSFDADLNDDWSNWCLASSSFITGDLGTPGITNDYCP